jgi:methylmalonyl-CoA mutase
MDFTRGFYEVGGFELIDTGGFNDVESAVHAAVNHGVSAVVICSTDGKYVDLVPEFVPALKAQKPDVIVILAGYPQDKVDDYRQDGVDDFIHIKADCYAMNKRLQDKLGVSS